MIKMDQTLGPIKKTIYQIISELSIAYKKGDEPINSLDIVIYESYL